MHACRGGLYDSDSRSIYLMGAGVGLGGGGKGSGLYESSDGSVDFMGNSCSGLNSSVWFWCVLKGTGGQAHNFVVFSWRHVAALYGYEKEAVVLLGCTVVVVVVVVICTADPTI